MREPPEIIASPKIDTAFAAEARALAARIPAGLSARDSLAWYEASLRAAYPNAVVREQETLARSEGALYPVWYASNRPKPFRIATSFAVDVSLDDAFDAYVDRVTEWQTAVELVPRRRDAAARRAHVRRNVPVPRHRLHGLVPGPRCRPAPERHLRGVRLRHHRLVHDDVRSLGDRTSVTVQGDYDLPSSILTKIADRLHLERAIGRDIERANAAFVRLCESLAEETGLRSAG